MPDTETERDVGSVFADFGGVEVPNTRVPTGSLEEVLTDFGATPVVEQPPADTTADVFKQFGGTPVSPPQTPKAPVEQTAQERTQKDDPNGLRATRAALEKEFEFIRDKVPQDDPRRNRMVTSIANRFVEQGFLEREEELGNRILLDGKPIKDDPAVRAAVPGLNKLEEIFIRFSGNAESTARRILGDEEGALAVTQAVNDLQEYNQILARNSVFGKKYGPIFDSITSSLGVSTLNAASGGIAGLSGMFALEEFNQGMKDGEKLDPVDQWQTSAMRALITFGSTMAGGLVARRAGVSSGDSLIPFFGKAATELFTKTGLKNLAIAGGIEAGEEGFQSLTSLMEQASSGTDPNATENLLDKVLLSASIGGFVGTVTQATSIAGKYDNPVQHFRDLLEGWGKRMKENPDSNVTVADPDTTSHGEDDRGNPISRETVNKELEALTQLDEEIEAQFEQGGAAELKQVISERESDLAGTKKEIDALNKELVGLTLESQIRNRRNRRTVLENYRKELTSKLAQDKTTLKDWRTQFETIHKQEREYIDSELERLSKQRDLPNVTPPKPPEPPAEGEQGTQTPKSDALNKELVGLTLESQIRNRRNRRTVLENYRKELTSKLAQDKTTLKDWRTQFETIHKQEREYIDSELERLSKQRDLPNVTPPKPPEPPAEGEQGTQTPTEPAPTPKTPTETPQESQFGGIRDDMARARQKSIKRVRDFLGFDKLDARESRGQEFDMQQAIERGLDEKALDLASDVLDQGRILNSVEEAGLQIRYVSLLDQIAEQSDFLQNNPDINQDAFSNRDEQIEEALRDIETISEAWIRTSSEVGAALQAQTRFLGIARSPERAVMRARRNKGEKLTAKEINQLQKLSDDVQNASEKVEGFDPGTDAYNRADFDLAVAMGEYDAAVANHKPSPLWLQFAEARNAVGMALTLTGDLTPFGRQGFFTMFTNPKQTLKNNATFFRVFGNKSVKDAQFESFMVNRTIRESENFKTLTKDFGVPIMERHTPYTAIEGSGLARLREVLSRVPLLKKLADLPGAQFDIAYRAWLNQTRYTMADLAFRNNQHLLSEPGGKAEMQQIIDHVLHATGHTKTDFGKLGQVLLTAPRWMLSRIALPVKAFYHIPRGIWSTMQGKPNASRHIAKQYVQAMAGATALSYAMEGAASIFFGPENVEMDRDISSPTFGFLTVNGRRYDITGGMGFVFRSANKLAQGTREVISGPDKEKDARASQTVGATLVNRASPAARDVYALFNSGRPVGERERMSGMEYVIRNSTPLTAQEARDATVDEGIGQGLFSAMMEMFAFSGFEKR